MLIAKEDLEIVNNFIDDYEPESDTYKFPKVDIQLSAYLQTPAEFVVRNYYKDYYAQISTDRVTLTIIKGDEFVWEIHLKNSTLQGFLDAQHLVNLLADYKVAISEIYNDIQPELKSRMDKEALFNKAKFGLDSLTSLFTHCSPDNKVLDTEKALKQINAIKFEDWDKKVLFISYEGKRSSIDYYRRAITNFENCLEQIKKLSNAIPA